MDVAVEEDVFEGPYSFAWKFGSFSARYPPLLTAVVAVVVEVVLSAPGNPLS